MELERGARHGPVGTFNGNMVCVTRRFGSSGMGNSGILMSAPLEALGYGDARVIVTFPPERQLRDGERWDQSRRVEEVVSGKAPAR